MRARDARNFIAHEGAAFFAFAGQALIIAGLKTLREEVGHLVVGTILDSMWAHEINHKEPVPSCYFETYSDKLDQWVFGHVLQNIEELHGHPDAVRAEGVLCKHKER